MADIRSADDNALAANQVAELVARLPANDDLTQAFGGATQASAEAQPGFIKQLADR